jgi:hypothetical protein
MIMNKSFFIAWIVGFIVWMAGDFGVHGAWLMQSYLANAALYRPEADQAQFMPWMIGAHVIAAGAVAWIYGRGVSGAVPWMGQGIRFGLGLAALMVPSYLIYYSVQPLPLDLVMKQCAGEAVVLVVLGIATAFVYNMTGKKAG